MGRGCKVADRDGDLVDKGLADGIDVELELGRNGDGWRSIGNGSPDELEDRLVVLFRTGLAH